MKKKTAAAWAAVLTLGIAVGAMSGAYAAEKKATQPPPGFLTAEQTLAEFNDIDKSTDLTLPDGVEWPQTPPAELSDTEGAFEIGFIESAANLYWLCAWENTIVDSTAAQRTQETNAGEAAIESFPESTWFTENNVDSDGSWQEDVLEPALAGDLTGVREDLASCGYFRANQ